jgi:hypothetical protein
MAGLARFAFSPATGTRSIGKKTGSSSGGRGESSLLKKAKNFYSIGFER